jgi:hypothetical protein
MLKTRFQKYDKFNANTSLVQLWLYGEQGVFTAGWLDVVHNIYIYICGMDVQNINHNRSVPIGVAASLSRSIQSLWR